MPWLPLLMALSESSGVRDSLPPRGWASKIVLVSRDEQEVAPVPAPGDGRAPMKRLSGIPQATDTAQYSEDSVRHQAESRAIYDPALACCRVCGERYRVWKREDPVAEVPRKQKSVVAPRPEHVAIVKPSARGVWSSPVIHDGLRRKQDGMAQRAGSEKHVGVLPNPADAAEVVAKATELGENVSTERHVCTDPVVDPDRLAGVGPEVS